MSIGTRGLTNTKVNFQYFSVGDATNTVAFGPGLLRGIAAGVPVEFIIQARDKVIASSFFTTGISHSHMIQKMLSQQPWSSAMHA